MPPKRKQTASTIKKKKQIVRNEIYHCRKCEEPYVFNLLISKVEKEIAKKLWLCSDCQKTYKFCLKEIMDLDLTLDEKRSFFIQ